MFFYYQYCFPSRQKLYMLNLLSYFHHFYLFAHAGHAERSSVI